MKDRTICQYKDLIAICKQLFAKKFADYGAAWRILRLTSLTDQILIKAQRIRSLQEKKNRQVEESEADEFIGIINYCLIALMQLKLGETSDQNETLLPYTAIEPLYDQMAEETFQLFLKKNHDYGEAWRDMRVSSITDIILMKLLRIKSIEDNDGKTLVSEGVKSNYQDILNYAVFCSIKLNAGTSV